MTKTPKCAAGAKRRWQREEGFERTSFDMEKPATDIYTFEKLRNGGFTYVDKTGKASRRGVPCR